jgi:hypothetical protein
MSNCITPWTVGMEPTGPFCNLGAPVTDDDGALVAIGAVDQASEGGFSAQFIDADAIRTVLKARSQ